MSRRSRVCPRSSFDTTVRSRRRIKTSRTIGRGRHENSFIAFIHSSPAQRGRAPGDDAAMSGLLSGVRIVAKEDVKKDLKREKKERKKERKRERKRAKRDAGGGGGGARDDSASSDDGDDDDDGPNAAPRDAAAPAALDAPAADHGNPDDWMAAATGASKARDPRSSAQIAREAEAERQRVVASERELNPFWKDGGDGVKPDDADARGKNALLGAGQSGGVGDGGASWRLKALRRAKERAEEEVRSIHWFPYDRVGVVNADP